MTVGFQGSETSRAEVTVYQNSTVAFRADRADLLYNAQTPGVITFTGQDQKNGEPTLISVRTQKQIGVAAGTFSFEFKVPTGSKIDWRQILVDDDWVDIVMSRHGRQFHVMRGLIDGVRRRRQVNNNGATITTYVVTGRDFGKIFAQQSWWFDRVTGGNWIVAAATRMFSEHHDFLNGNVAETVRNILLFGIQPNLNKGSSYWRTPTGIPGVSNVNFAEAIILYHQGFTNLPPRSSGINPIYFSPSSPYVWDAAMEFSDPHLCEVFVDLVNYDRAEKVGSSAYLQENETCTPEETRMAVIVRDRPFPNSVRDASLSYAPYFDEIPQYTIQRQHIQSDDLGRSGTERKNTFFATPILFEELLKGINEMLGPLADSTDIEIHGMRRMDAVTRYIPAANDTTPVLSATDLTGNAATSAALPSILQYKTVIRDLHCMNHLFVNGEINLNHGRPDIRVGGRVYIPGQTNEDDESYYVEAVGHVWTYERGLKTGLGVTHGWQGDDKSFVNSLNGIISKYNDPRTVPLIGPTDDSGLEATAGEMSPPTSSKEGIKPASPSTPTPVSIDNISLSSGDIKIGGRPVVTQTSTSSYLRLRPGMVIVETQVPGTDQTQIEVSPMTADELAHQVSPAEGTLIPRKP